MKLLLASLSLVAWSISNLVAQEETLFEPKAIYDRVYSVDFKPPDSMAYWINRLPHGGGANAKFKSIYAYYFILANQPDSALAILDQVTSIFETQPEFFLGIDQARLFFTWAKYGRMKYDEELCEKYAKKAHDVFLEEGDRLMAGSALQTLGGLEVQLGNLPKALDYTSRALRLKKENSQKFAHFHRELGTIAIIYDLMGLYERALYYYKEILRSVPKEDTDTSLGTLNNIGVLYENLGQLDSAFYYFELLAQSTVFDRGDMKYIAKFGKARIFNQRGRYQEANTLLREVYEQRITRPDLLYWRAKNYLDMHRLDSALAIARKEYLAGMISGGSRDNIIGLLEILTNIYSARKQYDSALLYKKTQYLLADSLFKKETQRKLSSLYVEIETMDKQIEIDQLNAEKKINEVRNRDLTIIILIGSFGALMAIVAGVFIYRNNKKKHLLLTSKLQFEIEQKSRDLHHQALRMIQINSHLSEIEGHLKKLRKEGTESSQEVQRLLATISLNKNLEKEWGNFSDYFSRVHEGFIEAVEARFPDLSLTEKRLVVLVRMNLTNKELAGLLNIELTSVKMAKYRLKRRLNLSEEQDLTAFLQNIQTEHSSK